jgi:multisubunit Na+/H+ antiporter MnhB subunit
MRDAAHLVLGSALRFYAPLIALFALSLLAAWPVNSGVGFVAGLAFGMVLTLHALVFGAAAIRTAFPPLLARAAVSAGAIAVLLAAALPAWADSAKAIEAGLFLATIGAIALLLAVLAGRAPTLRDEDW